MTVTSQVNKLIYACSGSQTIFPYTFRIFADADLEVILYTIADGTETTLTLTTDYTVSGAGDDAGGNVTTVATYSSLYRLIIRRALDYTQETDYVENDPFPANTHENVADKNTMLIQQLKEVTDRAVLQDANATSEITFPTPSSAGYFYFDGSSYSWVDVTSTSYAGTISRGVDASKPASPSTGDIYVATDTSKYYVCFTSGVWTNINSDVSYNEGAIEFVIDGGGSAIETGIKGDIEIPYDCTIISATLLTDQAGTIKIDLWNDTYANFPPTDADTITAGAEPEIASADTKYRDTTLTGWTVALTKGDTLRFNVDSCATITRCLISLKVEKT